MNDFSIISLSILLMILVFVTAYFKKDNYDILDLYCFMIALFFGAYTLIDRLFGIYFISDIYISTVVYLQIFLTILLLYYLVSFLPNSLKEFIKFKNLLIFFSQVDKKTVLLLSFLSISIDLYIFGTYGFLTYVGDELAQLDLGVPNWIGPLKSINWNIRFSLLMLIINFINYKKVGYFSIYTLIILPMLALQFVEGRRAMIELITLIFIFWTIHKNSSPYLLRRAPYALLILIMLFFASNVFQTYRTSLFSIQGIAGESGQVESFDEALTNSDSTIENLSLRTPMWRLNYEIMKNQLDNPSDIYYGYMMYRQFLNTVPSFLQKNKEVIASEELTSQIYNMSSLQSVTFSDDFPTNDFASYQTDFGFFSIILIPLVFIILILIGYFAYFSMKSKIFSSLIILLIIQFLIKIENGYNLPVLLRDIILIAGIYYSLGLFKRIYYGLIPIKEKNIKTEY